MQGEKKQVSSIYAILPSATLGEYNYSINRGISVLNNFDRQTCYLSPQLSL
jgi:hypothetical protein